MKSNDRLFGDSALDEQLAQSLTKPPESSPEELETLLREREAQQEARQKQALAEEKAEVRRLEKWTHTRGSRLVKALYRVLALLMGTALVLFLLYTVSALPPFGAADNPYNNEVSRRYLEKGLEETGAVNLVTGMILDYRAFDTFGESTVLFIAACSVLLLLRLGDHGKDEAPTKAMLEAEYDDRHYEPKNDLILQMAARLLTPVILLFGVYVVLNGHLSPGGGFSGGAIMGAGLTLYLNAFGFQKTERFFTYRTFRVITTCSLLTYAGLKSYSFFTGANGMESGVPLGTPGAILSSGFILPLNICVGLIVMCTMYAFYTLFRKGGM